MQEMIPFVGPHTDIMGPDMGTNEQVMAWFMETYSVYQGYGCTKSSPETGGSAAPRPARVDGPRRRLCFETLEGMLNIGPEKCDAVQGFGNVGSVAALC